MNIRVLLQRWRKMIELKIAYYSSLTFLYRGQQSEDQKQFGERLAFYKAAQEKIETALKFAKNFDRVDVKYQIFVNILCDSSNTFNLWFHF